MIKQDNINLIIDTLYRKDSCNLVSVLTKIFGPANRVSRGEFHPQLLTEPYLTVSRYTALQLCVYLFSAVTIVITEPPGLLVVKKIPYTPPTQYLYLDEKRKLGLAKRIRKQIDKFGLTNEQLRFATA